jgi:hypothetical protein
MTNIVMGSLLVCSICCLGLDIWLNLVCRNKSEIPREYHEVSSHKCPSCDTNVLILVRWKGTAVGVALFLDTNKEAGA